MLKRLKRWWQAWCDEQDKLCPNCGYYCTNSTVFCTPPGVRDA